MIKAGQRTTPRRLFCRVEAPRRFAPTQEIARVQLAGLLIGPGGGVEAPPPEP